MKRVIGLFAVALIAIASTNAEASIYGFMRITSNSTVNVSSQLQMSTIALSTSKVRLSFTNSGSTASEVTEVYFDDNVPGLINSIAVSSPDSVGTDFGAGGTIPIDLPGGTNLNPDFVTTAAFSADAGNGLSNDGINNPGDLFPIADLLILDIKLNTVYASAALALAAFDAALGLGPNGVRVGLQVSELPPVSGSTSGPTVGDTKDSFVNWQGPTGGAQLPEPASLAIWGLGLGIAGLVRLRRKR